MGEHSGNLTTMNAYFVVSKTFTGDISLCGIVAPDGSLTAAYNTTLIPTQGDVSAIVVQDTLEGGVFDTDATNGTLAVDSVYDSAAGADQTAQAGTMPSQNPAYNFLEIETIIIAE